MLTERKQFSAESNLNATSSQMRKNLESIMSESAAISSGAGEEGGFAFKLTQISDQPVKCDSISSEKMNMSPPKLSKSKSLRNDLSEQMNMFESLLMQQSASVDQNSEMGAMLKMLKDNFR